MLATLGLFGFLALLATVSAAMLAYLVTRLTHRVTALEKQTHGLALACRALHQKLDLLPAPAPDTPPLATQVTITADAGMNLNKRVQILRLHRRGESSAHIASVLNLPLAQVELVLKLQRQTAEAPVAARN